MEKYGQYRDKGSGIAPFFPIPAQPSNPLLLPFHVFLFFVRLPLLLLAALTYLLLIQHTPPGGLLRKANLWLILGIPGIWWIDLQVDGVKKGSLAQTPRSRLPGARTVIVSSHMSPIDVLYLAAIFDPVFTESFAGVKGVKAVSLAQAMALCFCKPRIKPDEGEEVQSLESMVTRNKQRCIVVFPEATTSNGRSILRLAPSVLSAGQDTRVFPVSLRYTPADIVTPIPGWPALLKWLWRLNSRPTHCIRVRVGAPLTISPSSTANTPPSNRKKGSYQDNFFDQLQVDGEGQKTMQMDGDDAEQDGVTPREQAVLDEVADALARLGRVKRVGLGVREKRGFVEAWGKRRGRGEFNYGLHLREIWDFVTRPRLHPNSIRITWHCRCGTELYADFSSTYPEAVKKLSDALNPSNIDPQSRTQGTSIGVSQPSSAHPSDSSTPVTSNVSNTSQQQQDQHDPQTGDRPANPIPASGARAPRFLELCINAGRLVQTLEEIDVTQFTTDAVLFHYIRQRYKKVRDWRMKKRFLLKPVAMTFVRFGLENKANQKAHIFEKPSLPPEAEVKAYRYHYEPHTPQPPLLMPSDTFIHYLYYCKDLPSQRIWLERLPKKLNESILRSPYDMPMGWGLHITEGPDKSVIFLTAVAVMSVCLGPLAAYIAITQSVQNATGVGGVAIGIVTVLIMCMQVDTGTNK